MSLLPMIEEDIEQYEEEYYEEPTCSTSVILCRDYFYDFFPPYYDESIWHKSTSGGGQVLNGKNSKKSSQYFMEYCDLKEEIREVLSFQYLCTLEIHKLFRDPYCGENIKNIAHMVDELCQKMETSCLSPGAKMEDSSKPFSFPSIRRMLGFYFNKVSKICELRTT